MDKNKYLALSEEERKKWWRCTTGHFLSYEEDGSAFFNSTSCHRCNKLCCSDCEAEGSIKDWWNEYYCAECMDDIVEIYENGPDYTPYECYKHDKWGVPIEGSYIKW
jgi:hypothetical protein